MKSYVVALIIAFCGQGMPISAIAQPPASPVSELVATDQQMIAKMSPDQKHKMTEWMSDALNRVDSNECLADNVLIATFCKATARNQADVQAQDLVFLAGDTEKTKVKASTDAIVERRKADAQISADRFDKMSDDVRKQETEEAINTFQLAENILDEVTDQASFDAACANIVKLGLFPNGSKAHPYSPELIVKMKQNLGDAKSKMGEGLTALKNKKHWWERFAPIALIAAFRSAQTAKRDKEKRVRKAHFEANAYRFGLSMADYGMEFSVGGTTYTLAGIEESTGQVLALVGKKCHRLPPEIVRNCLALNRNPEVTT